MYDQYQPQGFPISVSFITKNRTLYKEKINSKSSFNTLLENFKKNSQYQSQAKLKNKYTINGKQIRNNQSLEEIISQNMGDPYNAELCLELNDLLYSGDNLSPIYKKIIQPKENPFGLFVYFTREGQLGLQNFEEKTINLFELDKINEGSAYCNSNEDCFISGSKEKDNKNFWIINNNDFSIKKKMMPFGKENHSMIYLNFNQNEEWVFIAGGNNKKSFYYDLNKNYFINWGDTLDTYQNPALIRIGEYLYILSTINSKKNYWERTKIISPTRRWEKITPKIDKKLLANFPSDFAVSYDINGHILFIGGNNIINSNTTYVYDPINNEITLSKNGTNDNMDFSDKYFYKINNKYNIALPKNLTEKNELCVVNKDDQTLIKINIDIPNDYKKTKIKSKINFDDKKFLDNKNDEGTLTIKELDIKERRQNTSYNTYSNNIHNMTQAQYICNNCASNNNTVCQICHKAFDNNNLNYDNNQTKIKNPTRQNPYVEKIHDDYYPTSQKRFAGRTYGNYKENSKVKVEIIYDEYRPIRVNYELGKPYQYKFVKPKKIEEQKNINEEIHINKEQNNNIQNEVKVNIVKENNEQNHIKEEENNNIELNEENENEINNDNEEQQENEQYINEENNIEMQNEENIEEQQQNQEEHEENNKEEKNEENNEQVEEEHINYKHYGQKQKSEVQQNEILRDSLELNENHKEKDLIYINDKLKEDDNEIISPVFKLNFGFEKENEGESDDDSDIIKGLKLNFDKENKENVNVNINIEKSNEIVDNHENQENIIINGEEGNQNMEQHNAEEEEVHYENNENDENDNPLGEEGEYHNEQGEGEINFEEEGEEMHYEEEEENVNENGEEQNDVIEIGGQEGENGNENENENEENYINDDKDEEN